MNSNTVQVVRQGDVVTLTMPWSEVCCHMLVAGQVRSVQVTEGNMAQILNHDGSEYSFPITLSEAGIHTDQQGRYYVPSHQVVNYTPRAMKQVILFITRKTGERVTECCTEAAANKCLEEFVGNYSCSYERDEMGFRLRVTLEDNVSPAHHTPPAVRLSRLAKKFNIPAALED